MGNFSVTHMLIFFGIVILLFGGKRLPELGGSMGKAIREFKDALSGKDDQRDVARRELEEKEKEKDKNKS